MKKFIICIMTTFLVAGFVACNNSTNVEAEQEEMFITVQGGGIIGNYEVVYHKDTKVMYAISCSTYNSGNFTLLANPDGTPMLWEE